MGGARVFAQPKPARWDWPGILEENREILLSMHHQLGGLRPRGSADLVTARGETVAEPVDCDGSELLDLPK